MARTDPNQTGSIARLIRTVAVASGVAGVAALRGARRCQVLQERVHELSATIEHRQVELARRERVLRNLTARQAMILRMERELTGCDHPRRAAVIAARAARIVSGAEQVTVWTIDDERASVRLLADTSEPLRPQRDTDSTRRHRWAELGVGTIGAAIAERQPVTRTNEHGEIEWVWPLIVSSRVTGAMVVTQGPVAVDDSIVDALSTLAIHASAAIEAARLHSDNQMLARRDPLTHLPNRRAFDEDLEQERERSRRHGSPVSLVMIDLDRFKAINDTYGHPFGDEVLRRVADSIRGALRKSDSAYRLGGEEFAVLARETDIMGVQLLAERLRCHVEATLSEERGDPVELTASFGVAELGTRQPDVARLVAAADAALYHAKRTGRNRVATRASEPLAARSATDQVATGAVS